MTPPVVAIVGMSDSGKTRTAEALIQALVGQGYRIGAVKHCPHGHQVDRPGTDSALLFAAGAGKVVLSSPGRMTSIEQTVGDAELEEVVASFDFSCDLVIAEGFKTSGVPKVLVLGEEQISPPPENVIAVVSDDRVLEDVPCYGFHQIDDLARQVKDQLLAKASDVPTVSIVADGAVVPLAPFAAGALDGVVRGFLASLKGIPPSPKRIRIVLDSPPSRDG